MDSSKEKPKSRAMRLVLHPGMYAAAIAYYALYVFIGSHLKKIASMNTYAKGNFDLPFLAWILFAVSTLMFAVIAAFFRTLKVGKASLAQVDSMRQWKENLDFAFIRGWFFGLFVYAIAASVFQIRVLALLDSSSNFAYIMCCLVALVFFVLLFIIPKKMAGLLVNKSWTRGFYNVVVGFVALAVILWAFYALTGHPMLFRKTFP